jgi:putative phosphoesterase
MLLNKSQDFTQFKQLDIAIISDTHSDLVTDIYKLVSECDIVIHAGDIGSMEVLEKLKPKMDHVIAVAGNNDKPYMWDVPHWKIVKSLPDNIDILLVGGLLSVEHGHLHDMNKPSHDSLRQAHSASKMTIYGHTHHQIIDKSDLDHWVINPGAAGLTRTYGGSSCLKLSINNDDWQLKTYRFQD